MKFENANYEYEENIIFCKKSIFFQKVIGHYESRLAIEESLKYLQHPDGGNDYLFGFIFNCRCFPNERVAEQKILEGISGNDFSCDSLSDYESKTVTYNNILLNTIDDLNVDNLKYKPEDENINTDEVAGEAQQNPVSEQQTSNDFKCPYCDKTYKKKGYQVKHIKEKHSAEPNSANDSGISSPSNTEEKKSTKRIKKLKFSPLSSVRKEYVDVILKNLDYYFPIKHLKSFDIFDQGFVEAFYYLTIFAFLFS